VKTIYFLSDFGNGDVYAGVCRAIIANKAPEAKLIDLAHDLPVGEITHAAYQVYAALPYLKTDGVILAVVDPGVGGDRRGLIVRGNRYWYVVPDNGLLSLAMELDTPIEAWELDPAKYVGKSTSATFHGRDVFAPAAALLAAGFPASQLGHKVSVDSLIRIGPKIVRGFEGEILTFDRFGNAITNLRPKEKPEAVHVVGRRIPFARTFSDVPYGKALAYLGSSGLVEIAVHGGSAQEAFRLLPGAAVSLQAPEKEPPPLITD